MVEEDEERTCGRPETLDKLREMGIQAFDRNRSIIVKASIQPAQSLDVSPSMQPDGDVSIGFKDFCGAGDPGRKRFIALPIIRNVRPPMDIRRGGCEQ